MYNFKSAVQPVLTEEQLAFQKEVSDFVDAEVVPNFNKWYYEDHQVDKALYKKMGEKGLLLTWADPKYGGRGLGWIESWIVANEFGRRGMGGVQVWLHSDVVGTYFEEFASDAVKDKFLPDLIKGNKVLAVAMTEPEYGSNVGGAQTSAVEDGDDYIVNGHKIFISNGWNADVIVTLVRTDPDPAAGHKGLTLIAIDTTESEGVRRKKLDKMGGHVMDTSELWFDNVRVPKENVIGEVGRGFYHVMKGLQQERILAALMAELSCEVAFNEAVARCQSREVFGRPLSTYQNTQFVMAEEAAKIMAAKAMVDNLVLAHGRGEEVNTAAAACKLFTCELVKEVADVAVQMHGGYGLMMDYPIARMYTDARISSITAGTSEVMKMVVSGDVFPRPKKKK